MTTETQKIPTGYKKTEIGVIPQDWDVCGFFKAVRPKTGQVDPKVEPYNSMILVAPDHIESDTGRLLNMQTAREQGAISGKYLFSQGDIIYSKIRPYLKKAFLADFQGLCSADMYPLTPSEGIASPYILAILLSHRFTIFAISVSARSGIPKINREELSEYKIASPSFPEQCAISIVYSDTDALIEKLEKLIKKKKFIKQGAMHKLLTGRLRLPGFKGKWDLKKLGDLLDYEQPSKYIVKNTEYNDKNNIPVLTAGKSFILGYTGEEFGIFNKLPVIIFDDFTTASRFVNFSFKVKSSAMKILKPRNNDVDLRFVFEKLQLIDFKLTDHKRYWISEYQNMEIEAPLYDEQTAIANVLSDMETEIEKLESQLAKYRNIKQGMMQSLLTGKIRLI